MGRVLQVMKGVDWMVEATQQQIDVNGNQVTVYEWGTTNDKPTVVFFHATGFHARCWDGVIRLLEGVHCIAVDAAGHGTSEVGSLPHTWKAYGEDVVALMQALNLTGTIAVGHSMGGNSVVRAAAKLPEAFAHLLLIDPVILPSQFYARENYSINGHFVLKRRREWESAAEMFNSFKGRGAFAKWQDDILWDYCEHGLVPQDGGYVLACAPEVEAHIYTSSDLVENADVYDAIAKIEQPVRVLRCTPFFGDKRDMLASPTAPDLASKFKHGTDYELADNTHFIPMESPGVIAEHIHEILNAGAHTGTPLHKK